MLLACHTDGSFSASPSWRFSSPSFDRLAWANVSLLASKSIGVPLAALGAFVTAFYIGYVIANVLGGILTDRIGPRRMLVFALVPLAVSTFAFG